MVFLLIVAVTIVLFLVWGIAHDLRKRRRNDDVTDHDARAVARKTRNAGAVDTARSRPALVCNFFKPLRGRDAGFLGGEFWLRARPPMRRPRRVSIRPAGTTSSVRPPTGFA